ncbi:Histidine phosphatase superfamily, clade-1 [Penicillium expansum]|uniref:Histidine phosphatase superfamily, clade-1 n=1 Tax=Penicillium expansum TaxID=27334 RepID=A0A0A2I462_PENEN|nr:Histidine phosphatase superfamily, clade-1 [Penicillium expansum]KGO37151.1 Histidine phosphatase superfamily, clade-1 [Penicillium expansum]KGO61459.1 Histidine phosphatase superfamily, clade-1 [Penicillium expansum]
MNSPPLLRFTTVTGYFLQDDPATDPDTFDYVKSNFGLIEKYYDEHLGSEQAESQWRRFDAHIQRLNASETKTFKVLFLGRHGEGVHNVAERKYGTKKWDDYWSLQDGDEDGNWVDARLTEQGRRQAQAAHAAWGEQIKAGIPSPESYYVSPLNRCLETAQITFQGLAIPGTDPFKPTIKELLRETMGQHTCDRRSTASEIAEEYPEYRFEAEFSEEDKLWDAKVRESNEHRNDRLRCLLNDIFAHDESTYISLTAHSGAITSILEVVGHRRFALATGAVIPVLISVEKGDPSQPESQSL